MSLAKVASTVVVVVVLALVALVASAWAPDRSVASLKARWAPPPSQFLSMDGMQVHVRDEGPRDDPTPIVFLHGTGSSLHSWQDMTERLSATHRVIRFDRPGFGLTGPNPSDDYSMAYYADFTARLLDRLGVKRAILVGNSSGGYVAWRFAAAHPDRTAALVLLAPGGLPRSTPLPPGLKMAMSPRMGPVLERILPRSQVRKGLEGTFGDASKVTDEMVDRSYEVTLRAGNRKALGETLRQGLRGRDGALLKQVQAPTLIVWGAEDSVIPIAPDAEQFHREIVGSRLPGVGHLPQEEAPDATTQAMVQLLSSLNPEATQPRP
jgi:pimeloyl-ACP methyl ester carboxylesterase